MNISPELANSVLETLAQDIRDAQPADPTDVEGLQELVARLRKAIKHAEATSAYYRKANDFHLGQWFQCKDALVQAFVLVDNALQLQGGIVDTTRGSLKRKAPQNLLSRDADQLLKSVLSVVRETLPDLVETNTPAHTFEDPGPAPPFPSPSDI